MNDFTVTELNRVIEILDAVRERTKTETWYDNDWNLFIRKMRLLNPQSYGPRIQNYLFNRLGWERVPANLDRGDVRNSLGQYFEAKVSLITPKNQAVNIVQVRPWQQITGHHIFVIDATDQYKLYHFALSKNEMKVEIELMGSSAHGTTKALKNNVNREYRLGVPWLKDNHIYQRWINQYLQVDTSSVLTSHQK